MASTDEEIRQLLADMPSDEATDTTDIPSQTPEADLEERDYEWLQQPK